MASSMSMSMSLSLSLSSPTAEAKPSRKPIPAIPPYGPHAVEVKELTFSYQQSNNSGGGGGRTTTAPSASSSTPPSSCMVLQDLNLSLERGSRCLLIGANGSGTL
jgi:ABC-type multidrug transport system fused ATPase/permease subunit